MTAAVSPGRDQRALMAFCMPGKAGTADCCVDGSAKRTLGDDLTLPVIELAKRLSAEEKPEKKPKADEVDYTAEAQKELASQLGRGVRIVTGKKKGRIELEYYGMDDLNDLLEALALLKVRKAQKGPQA